MRIACAVATAVLVACSSPQVHTDLPTGTDTDAAPDSGAGDQDATTDDGVADEGPPDADPAAEGLVDVADVADDAPGEAVVQPCPAFDGGKKTGELESDQITEASGLVASRKNPGVLWVHNDSGDQPRIFAISETGRHLGEWSLEGATADDWEDMAADGKHLYLADIGDNAESAFAVFVHRVEEPTVSPDQEPVSEALKDVTTWMLNYPDNAHDAETLLVDPEKKDLYVVTKDFSTGISAVFKAAAPLSTSKPNVMEHVSDLVMKVPLAPSVLLTATGGDVTPSGDAVLIVTYSSAFWWARAPGTALEDAFLADPCPAPVPVQPMNEAVAFDFDGLGYFTVPEGKHAPIHHFSPTDH